MIYSPEHYANWLVTQYRANYDAIFRHLKEGGVVSRYGADYCHRTAEAVKAHKEAIIAQKAREEEERKTYLPEPPKKVARKNNNKKEQ